MQLRPVEPAEIPAFRHMVEAYWHEIMPTAGVLRTEQRRDAYFAAVFSWQEGDWPPCWAVVDAERVGFVHFAVHAAEQRATIEDFYVAPAQRRKGIGALMVQTLYGRLDTLGIECVELFVRRDTPYALAFWEAQGFRIASYRMRQYRDPATGRSWIGALSSDFEPEA